MSFKIFLILSSGGPCAHWSRTIYAILVEVITGCTCWISFALVFMQFYLLLSPYLFFISFLYLDLYVLGDDASIS